MSRRPWRSLEPTRSRPFSFLLATASPGTTFHFHRSTFDIWNVLTIYWRFGESPQMSQRTLSLATGRRAAQSILSGACIAVLTLPVAARAAAPDLVDLRRATIVIRPGTLPVAERTAARVLEEELEKRLKVDLPVSTTFPTGVSAGPAAVAGTSGTAPAASASAGAGSGGESVIIALASGLGASTTSPWKTPLPAAPADAQARAAALRPEGYRLLVERQPAAAAATGGARATGAPAAGRTVIWILGADPRGALFGVGELLRALHWDAAADSRAPQGLPATLDVATAPAYAIRGHQLGYRQHSNTYDGWSVQHYEQYIRELALFGGNSIENIPFQDARVSPHFTLPRDKMNQAISEICARYDQDYWIWTPADFDLKDTAKRAQALTDLDALFQSLPRLDAVFFPGGDPGDNAAQLVLPYLRDVSTRLQRHHPRAKVWLSLQHFSKAEIDFVYTEINGAKQPWLGGLVAGPGSPPLKETRARLDARYPLRDYPDVTHVVRAQYPLPWLDPAFNFTLGREPINPRAAFYAALHDRLAPFTNGFISYSDGVNDDVNKVVWTRKSWTPAATPREILIDYARFFFGQPVAERAADGLLALEKNVDGPLATNGAVDGTLTLWQQIEREQPALAGNWRWQMALLRAYYDAYTRHRLIAETALEQTANRSLVSARTLGSAKAIDEAMATLRQAETENCCAPWRQRIEELGAALFQSIRMQTSMDKYGASGAERGAVLDFVDFPLNNRWWIEDELAKVRALPDEPARVARLQRLGAWEDAGPGGFYDVVGDVSRSPHVVRARLAAGDPIVDDGPIPHFIWEEQGKSRKRLTWQVSLRWPLGLEYDQLDRSARYVVRLGGNGDVKLRIDGEPVEAAVYSKELGSPKEYVVPASALADGRLVLTFDAIDESDRNWRQFSRLSEVWLVKQNQPSTSAGAQP